MNSPARSRANAKPVRSPRGKSSTIDESKCFIKTLFDHNLHHFLQSIFMLLSLKDLDNCKLVNSQWNAFLKGRVWGSKVCRRSLQPKWKASVSESWFEEEASTTHQFPQVSSYRRSEIAADRKEVVVGLGSAVILVWNRITMEQIRVFPWAGKTSIRGLGFDSYAPALALTEDVLFAYYPHETSIYLFDRQSDYKHIQTVAVPSDRKKKMMAFVGSNMLLLTLEDVIKVYDYDENNKLLSFKHELTGPNSGIASAAIDGINVYVGNAGAKSVAKFNVSNRLLEGSISTAPIAPDLIAVQHPYLATTAYKGSNSICSVFSLESGNKVRDIYYPYYASPPPGYFPRDSVYDIQIHENRMVIATFTGNALLVKKATIRYHAYDLDENIRRNKLVFTCTGQHRRIRYPAFKLEEDCLIVGDDSGGIVVRSFWRVKERKKEDGSAKGANLPSRWMS